MTNHELPGSIFTQPWWLDIVAPNQWKDIQVTKGGEIFARMPIVQRKKRGFSIIEMPLLTHKMGPWIKQTSPKQERKHSNERKLLEKLIEKLPKVDFFSYNLDTKVQSFLPFLWNGFEQNSFTTFKFTYPFKIEEVWNGMKSSVRRDIKRAEEKLVFDGDLSAEDAYSLVKATFVRQNIKPPYSKNILQQIYKEASLRDRISVFGARDEKGQLVASQIYIHDDDCTYYLSGGIDSESDIPGLASFLIWEGIKIAHSKKNSFDFEGSSIKSIENFFSSFGPEIFHYHRVSYVSKRYAPVHFTQKLLKRLKK